MNASQQIFSILYAILFGTVLASLGSFKAFPWGFLFENGEKRKRLLRRLAVSIFIFNLVPLLLYVIELKNLQEWPYHIHDASYLTLLCAASAAMVIFIPYRLYHIIMLIFNENLKSRFIYSYVEYNKIKNERGIRNSIKGNVFSVVVYFTAYVISFFIHR